MGNTIIAAIIAVFASTGFWALITKIYETKVKSQSAESKLIMGLAYNKIMELGMLYINRGYVTEDEYRDLNHYLYEPYRQKGGNGTAAKVMKAVDNLPLGEKKEEHR